MAARLPRHARAQMADFGTAMQTTNSGFAGIITGLVGFGAQAGMTGVALKGVKEQTDALTASLTPMQAAQQAVTTAQNNLNLAVEKYGVGSPQATAAASAYRAAQAEVARQSGATQLAIEGVTDAMIAQRIRRSRRRRRSSPTTARRCRSSSRRTR
jgi:hypothetical protein